MLVETYHVLKKLIPSELRNRIETYRGELVKRGANLCYFMEESKGGRKRTCSGTKTLQT